VILPGVIALALSHPVDSKPAANSAATPQAISAQQANAGLIPAKTNPETGEIVKDSEGKVVLDYDLVIPNMLLHYFPTGVLGLGLTALLASFMSGMAGNVTAFNTVWTYDIYQTYIRKKASDQHYLWIKKSRRYSA
jgi:SSS family solute:Na+ symporter